jgi:hypothetical protein
VTRQWLVLMRQQPLAAWLLMLVWRLKLRAWFHRKRLWLIRLWQEIPLLPLEERAETLLLWLMPVLWTLPWLVLLIWVLLVEKIQ